MREFRAGRALTDSQYVDELSVDTHVHGYANAGQRYTHGVYAAHIRVTGV